MTRRTALHAIASMAAAPALQAAATTTFPIGCMTIPYQQFSFERGIKGIAAAGFRHVAWGPHQTDSANRRIPTIGPEESPARARELSRTCRDLGLNPILMFVSHYPENPGAVDVHKRRIDQAQAAGIPYLLAFGSPKGTPEQRPAFIRTLQQVAPHAAQAKVLVVIKQHGGITATGALMLPIVKEVASPAISMFYDPGNTWWYVDTDANADLQSCASSVRGIVIKDFRALGKLRATCGPGFGQTDHYKMLAAVQPNGGEIPLVCENIAEPFVARPETPEAVDRLARQAREYLDSVSRGILAAGGKG